MASAVVPVEELLGNNCNLDRKNPRAKEGITHLPPGQLVASILEKEQRIIEIMGVFGPSWEALGRRMARYGVEG